MGHRSIYHDGWRAVCPWPGPSFAEAGMPFGTPIPADTLTELDAKALGAVPRRGGLGREPRRRRRQPGQAHRDDRDVVRGGGQVQGDAGGRARRAALPRRATAAHRRPHLLHLLSAAPRRCPGTPARGSSTAPTASRPRWTSPRAAPTASFSPSAAPTAGCSFYVKDGRLQYVQNYVARDYLHVESKEAVPEGRHSLRFEFEVTGPPGPRRGQGSTRSRPALHRRQTGRRRRSSRTPRPSAWA